MPRFKSIIIIFFLLILRTLSLFSQTLYAFIFANTEDEGIGCIYDVENIAAFLSDTQKETGMTVKMRIHLTMENVSRDVLKKLKNTGEVIDGWSKEALDKEIKALNPANKDVVFFYYSGHGGRMSSKKNRWPDMAMEKGTLVDMGYLTDAIKKKSVQPRLTIIFGDCCNSYMDRSFAPPMRSIKSTAALKKLFLESSGVIIASGSEPGQYSLGGSDGGVFTNAYLKAATNPTSTDWESVLNATRSIASRNSGGEQFPQYEINGKLVSNNIAQIDNGTTPDTPAGPGYLTIVEGKAAGQRKPGNSAYPFTELVKAGLDATGDDLVVTLELADFPAKLTFYDPQVPDNYMEYEWAANIDLDGNGTTDYAVSLSNFKWEGAEKTLHAAADLCQASIWQLDESGGTLVEHNLEVRVKKNVIRLTIPDYTEVFDLTPGATVYFSALYYLGGESCIP